MPALDSALVDRARAVLRDGGIVAYPTDTFYGLAVDPRVPAAVAKLFAIKGRAQGQAVPLIASDQAQAERAGAFNAPAARLAAAFWPGPLSIVVPAHGVVCADAQAPDRTIAVRVPACDAARELARALGFCITATSANFSGEAPATSPGAITPALAGMIDLVIDGGTTPGGAPSTLVDVRGAAPRLVRAGAIAWERVLKSLQ